MKKQSLFLHTPPGTKPFYKEEALFRNKIEKKLSSFFEQWNFIPIQPPIIDYYDVYAPSLSDKQKKGSVKFINREGDLVLLRNDITLFSAKFIASRLSRSNELLKYYYSGSIIRCEDKDSPEEYYQIGCEIVGNKYNCEEAELLLILMESVEYLEIKDSVLHIGDKSFFNNILKKTNNENYDEIITAVRLRDMEKLKTMVKDLSIENILKEDFITLAGFIGSIDDFFNLSLSNESKKYLTNFFNTLNILKKLDYEDMIVVDMSEISEQLYYNSIIFHLYRQGVETPLVSGGRYDKLFDTFGLKKSAVGFSYWLYPLEKSLSKNPVNGINDRENIFIKEDNVENIVNMLDKARKLVKNNVKIQINYNKQI